MDAAPDADRLPQRRRTHGPVGKDNVKCCLNVRMNSDEFHILRTNDAMGTQTKMWKWFDRKAYARTTPPHPA